MTNTIDNNEANVLSVSYGCFSIRLQGFADPFAIMKRVTEYFRVISLSDPSFGSKPLFEDASILQSLEETAFGNDVDIATEGSTLTLTPADELSVETPEVLTLTDDALTPESEVFVLEEEQNDVPMHLEPSMEATTISDTVVDDVKEEPAAEAEHTAASLQDAIAKALLTSAPAKPDTQTIAETETAAEAKDTLQSAIEAAMQKVLTSKTQEPTEQPLEQPAPTKAATDKPRKFRIIRNDYDYDTQSQTEANEPEAPKSLSVNPFRKFPVKKEALSTPTETATSEPLETPEDSIASSYRKLRIDTA